MIYVTGMNIEPGDNMMVNVFSDDYLEYWKTLYDRALSGEFFKTEIHSPSSIHAVEGFIGCNESVIR